MEKEEETKERVKTKASTRKETTIRTVSVGTRHLGIRKAVGIRMRTTRLAIRL